MHQHLAAGLCYDDVFVQLVQHMSLKRAKQHTTQPNTVFAPLRGRQRRHNTSRLTHMAG